MAFIPPITRYWVLVGNEKLRDITVYEFVSKFFITSGLPAFKYFLKTKTLGRSQSVRLRTILSKSAAKVATIF
jgi:hypothetical protein